MVGSTLIALRMVRSADGPVASATVSAGGSHLTGTDGVAVFDARRRRHTISKKGFTPRIDDGSGA